ncbi:MAG: hypothetical protein SPM02_07630, partial [Bacteroidales bacterium]|nr:hypothetical protein [Bacteroidales bacterium]
MIGEGIPEVAVELGDNGGVSAVLYYRTDVGGQIVAGSHHDCCTAHGNAVEDYKVVIEDIVTNFRP